VEIVLTLVVPLGELDRLLHDARIPLSSVGLDEESQLHIEGHVMRAVSRWRRARPWMFRLCVPDTTSLEIDDPDHLGSIGVEEVRVDETRGELIFVSSFIGEIRVRTAARSVELELIAT